MLTPFAVEGVLEWRPLLHPDAEGWGTTGKHIPGLWSFRFSLASVAVYWDAGAVSMPTSSLVSCRLSEGQLAGSSLLNHAVWSLLCDRPGTQFGLGLLCRQCVSPDGSDFNLP